MARKTKVISKKVNKPAEKKSKPVSETLSEEISRKLNVSIKEAIFDEPVELEPEEPAVEKEAPAEEPIEEPKPENKAKPEKKPDEEKPKKVKKTPQIDGKLSTRSKVIAALLALFVLVAIVVDVKLAGVNKFPKGVSLNGTDVSKMDIEHASQALTVVSNDITIARDNEAAKKLHTSFAFSNATDMSTKMKLATVDPRRLIKGKVNYKMGLKVVAGYEETAATIDSLYPLEEGKTVTQNAYVDLNTMTIVEAVEGDSLDSMKLAKDIAKQRKKDPLNKSFKFAREDYILKPTLYAEDMNEQLAFATKYLAPGMDIEYPDGKVVHIGAPQMGMFILYTPEGPEYSEEGAMQLARDLTSDYMSDELKVMTQEGERILYNYAITSSIDAEASAKSIIKAAKKGELGRISTDSNTATELGNHVEVSLSSQTLYLVENGTVTYTAPVVTGTYGHRTPSGIFRLAYKTSPARLKGKNDDGTDYDEPVTFWMPFNGDIGLHDAPWRGVFGGSIYQWNGSHGCINLPYNAARTLYYTMDSGYIVIVYD